MHSLPRSALACERVPEPYLKLPLQCCSQIMRQQCRVIKKAHRGTSRERNESCVLSALSRLILGLTDLLHIYLLQFYGNLQNTKTQ